jgi:thiol:disulfide interchange protein
LLGLVALGLLLLCSCMWLFLPVWVDFVPVFIGVFVLLVFGYKVFFHPKKKKKKCLSLMVISLCRFYGIGCVGEELTMFSYTSSSTSYLI